MEKPNIWIAPSRLLYTLSAEPEGQTQLAYFFLTEIGLPALLMLERCQQDGTKEKNFSLMAMYYEFFV